MRRNGFTFIEMMLVVAMFATLSVAVFTCLSNGIKLWDRGRQLMSEEDVAVFFDRFAADLRNTYSYSQFYFTGDENALTFPSVVWTPADRVSVRASEGMVDQLGLVRYAYDPAHATLVRQQANYAQALKDEWAGEEIVVMDVKGFRVHYFFTASKDPQISVDPGSDVPAGVEVELVIGVGKEGKVFKRYMAVPAGV